MPGKIATTRSFIFTWIRTPQEAFQPQTFPVWSAGHSLHIGVNTWPRANQGHLLQSTGWKHTSLEACSDFVYFLLVTQSAHIKYHLHEGKGSFHLESCSVYASTVEKGMGCKWMPSYSCSPTSYHTPAEPRREPRRAAKPFTQGAAQCRLHFQWLSQQHWHLLLHVHDQSHTAASIKLTRAKKDFNLHCW